MEGYRINKHGSMVEKNRLEILAIMMPNEACFFIVKQQIYGRVSRTNRGVKCEWSCWES